MQHITNVWTLAGGNANFSQLLFRPYSIGLLLHTRHGLAMCVSLSVGHDRESSKNG